MFEPKLTSEEMAKRVGELEHQVDVDRELIHQLVGQVEADKAEIAQLEVALSGARRIGAAVGILMASNKITDEAAFELLRDVSQKTGRKLRDIADDVMLLGTLP